MIWLWNLWYFGKLVADGRTRRFDGILLFDTMPKLASRYEIFGSCLENCHSCNSELTESQVFKATFPWDELVWRLLPYRHNSSNSCQRFRSPIIPRKGWEVMSFNPHKTTFLSLLQHLNRVLIPVSDKIEFQLASISLSSGMFSAKLPRAASVKLSIPAMFSDETRWQLSARVLRVSLEAAHWRRPRCWRERQLFAMIAIPWSVTSSHQEISKTFN